VSHRARISIVAGLSIALGLLSVAFPVGPRRAAGQSGSSQAHHHGPMTDAEMKQWSDVWWSTHKPVGLNATGGNPPAATFRAVNFQFDLDNDPSTAVDTAKIEVGQTVAWQWIAGSHTTTNGQDSGDPQLGTLFDQPLTISNPTFSFTFNSPGTIPFFCRPHEGFMAGVVKVTSVTGVEPPSQAPLGFTRNPSPNPSAGGIQFSFTLREPGRVRAEVFDARGRRVAVPLDLDLAAGPHKGEWNGRGADGTRMPAGIYYLRLRLPGYQASRTVTLTR